MTVLEYQIQNMRREMKRLQDENTELRQRIGKYVCEFHVCRFCANLHGDCNPNGNDCIPEWRGL